MSQSNSTFFWDSEARPIDYGTPTSTTATAGFHQVADMDWYTPVLAEQAALMEEQRRRHEQARIDADARVREFAQMMRRAQQHRNVTNWSELLGKSSSTQEMMDKFGETTEY